jgi:phosphatidylinositol phospholipase C delta
MYLNKNIYWMTPKTCVYLRPGIQGDDNLGSMLVGTVMRKVKSRTWKKQRYFKLQEDCMTIWYKSKKAGKPHSTCEWGTA